ncbi:uncharacterized protein LOC141641040 [Silene latifolia]|uniref:uncharacterized protein LOC141641040 n=1 Tax=Silene latifolia TaxID=37657 RepID=UPI003D7824AF
MIDEICSKKFPKRFNERTTVDGDGYPVYKRRENGTTIEKNGKTIHNGYVVPYNANLLLKYRAHINVEWCNQARSIKYLFKYINKGYDRVIVSATRFNNGSQDPNQVDQIQEYYDCRYISPCEAIWNIFAFPIHYRIPPILRLDYHLPNEQNVIFHDYDPIDEVVERSSEGRTKFTAWMEYNNLKSDGRDLTYCEFPTKFVWKKKERAWKPREKGFTLGRMYHMSPNDGERYYLRNLLNFVKGPKSYKDIRTINGVPHTDFKEACYALGLFGDDKDLVKPELVWEKTWKFLSDDILHRRRTELRNPDLQLTDKQLQNYALSEIESWLQRNGSSLLLADELSYDKDALKKEHEVLTSSMTDEQKSIYRKIMFSVENGQGGVYFVYGYGGTGKTFLWKTLCAGIRSKGEIVIAVASSGIAAILLPGGQTAHARLSIPLNVDENSTCHGIRPGTDLAELIKRAKLIIWDEAPMVNRYCFEALDRSLRDIMRTSPEGDPEKPFGGKVVVFGGDFDKYCLLYLKEAGKILLVLLSVLLLYGDISRLEHNVLKLTKNMRLQVGSAESDVDKIRQFSEWILEVGNGLAGGPNDGVANIELPEDILIQPGLDPIATIVESTYPSLKDHLGDPRYFTERAVLAPTHDVVEAINDYVLDQIQKEEKVYLRSDEFSKEETNSGVRELYSTEFLNSIRCSSLPNHSLKLKVGAIVMLLINIDHANGLCNGTRMEVNHLGN